MSPSGDDEAASRRPRTSRLALIHGFTQTGRSWDPLRPALERRFEVVTPDLPGHGARSEVAVDLSEAARLLAAECGEASYVGYSMGGRVGLHLALAHPELVRRLVLVGASPGIEDAAERAARRQADEDLARSLEEEGLEEFLARWLDLPLFAGLPPDAAGLAARRQNTSAGLAASLRRMGTGSQEPLWHRLVDLTMPVLLVAGERDPKFSELASEMARRIGDQAAVAVVPDAGHACHLERPEAFLDVVVPFLSST